ncbi:MAG: polysaccharide biosynthesis tyrosine autokinase [Acidobacteriia bacterium]|nr:polysaccharide biosynthesis tyrosine autokinase [Terriglobia bacterium]
MNPSESDNYQIELFKARDGSMSRRHASQHAVRASELEKPPDLLACWRVIRKRRWTVLLAFGVLFGIVFVGTLRQKPVYRAKVLIEIDKENPGLVTAQEVFQLDEVTDTYLETQYKVLNSDDLAQRVIAQLRLDQVPEFRPAAHGWLWNSIRGGVRSVSGLGNHPPGPTADLQEAVLEHFQRGLGVKPIRRSRAVEIDFDSLDPNLSANIVNAMASGYMQKNLEARYDATQRTSDWLSLQLADLKSKLEKSEDAMQQYAAGNGLLVLDTGNGSAESITDQSLRELQQELNHAQDARYEKESVYGLIQAGDFGSLPGVQNNKLLQDLSTRLADLQRERAQLTVTFTEDYPRVRQIQSQIAEIQAALDRERGRAAREIGNEYSAAVQQEKLLQQALAEKKQEANQVAEKSVQYGILRRDVDTNKNLYDGLLQRLKEAGVSAGLNASNIRVVDPGMPSYQPAAPKIALNLGLASVLGIALGVCAAFFQEHMDQTFQDARDVDRYLHIPALAFIPSLESLRRRKGLGMDPVDSSIRLHLTNPKETGRRTLVISRPRHDPEMYLNSVLSEAFRELRTSLLLSGTTLPAHSILVTSAQPSEGKTTVAMNLAASLAQLGRRTLLIDADMRRPSIQKYFPQSKSQLSAYLAGKGKWQDMVSPTEVSGLDVVLSGRPPANPAELLSSEAMRALMYEAAASYQFVVLDSPPLLNVADSRILASLADSTLLVVKCGATPRQVVQYAESQARAAGANLAGVVLNYLNVCNTGYSYQVYHPSSSEEGVA